MNVSLEHAKNVLTNFGISIPTNGKVVYVSESVMRLLLGDQVVYNRGENDDGETLFHSKNGQVEVVLRATESYPDKILLPDSLENLLTWKITVQTMDFPLRIKHVSDMCLRNNCWN